MITFVKGLFVAEVPKWDVNNRSCGISFNNMVGCVSVAVRAESSVRRPSHGMMNECNASDEVSKPHRHPYLADSDIFTCNVSV